MLFINTTLHFLNKTKHYDIDKHVTLPEQDAWWGTCVAFPEEEILWKTWLHFLKKKTFTINMRLHFLNKNFLGDKHVTLPEQDQTLTSKLLGKLISSFCSCWAVLECLPTNLSFSSCNFVNCTNNGHLSTKPNQHMLRSVIASLPH